MIKNEEKERLRKELTNKIPELVCPMCGSKKFSMSEGYISNTLQENTESIAFGGKAIPTIAIICDNCGFVSQHAIGRLGLFNNDKNKTNESDNK